MIKKVLLTSAAMVALLLIAAPTVFGTFTAITGSGGGGAYVSGDKFGYQTVEKIRTNFNDHETRILAVEAAYITASSSTTFTNKTFNAESTGNILTFPVKIWIPAAICNNATPASHGWSFPTSNPGVPACQTGSNTQFGTMDFADSADLSAQYHLRLPSDWTSTVDVAIKWFTSATSGDVVWQIATICVADAETSDPAFNTASTVTDTAKGTTLQENDASITTVTVTGCAAGELMFVKVKRDAAHASDTLAATARLIGIEITYRRAI